MAPRFNTIASISVTLASVSLIYSASIGQTLQNKSSAPEPVAATTTPAMNGEGEKNSSASRLLKYDSKLKKNAPAFIATYWAECLEYRSQIISDAQKAFTASQSSLNRMVASKVGTQTGPYSQGTLYFPTAGDKQTAINSAQSVYTRSQEILQRASSDIIVFKPIRDPMIQNGESGPIGTIGVINHIIVQKVFSDHDAIIAISVNASAATPMHPEGARIMQTGGDPGMGNYLAYPPSPMAYQGGFNYFITGMDLKTAVDGSILRIPVVVQVDGIKTIEVDGRQRRLITMHVVNMADYFEAD